MQNNNVVPFIGAATVPLGRWVEYNGSIAEFAGRSFRVLGHSNNGRYFLRNEHGEGLDYVGRGSITPIE